MSNKKTAAGETPGFNYRRPPPPKRVLLKLNVPVEVKNKLMETADQTGFSMVQIVSMLTRYYCNRLDVEHDMRRMLAEVAKKNLAELKLSVRQKKVIRENVEGNVFTKDLI